MTKIKIHIFNVKLPFYPPCEVKCELQNRVSTHTAIILGIHILLPMPSSSSITSRTRRSQIRNKAFRLVDNPMCRAHINFFH